MPDYLADFFEKQGLESSLFIKSNENIHPSSSIPDFGFYLHLLIQKLFDFYANFFQRLTRSTLEWTFVWLDLAAGEVVAVPVPVFDHQEFVEVAVQDYAPEDLDLKIFFAEQGLFVVNVAENVFKFRPDPLL